VLKETYGGSNLTSALDGGQSLAGASPPRKEPPVSIGQEAGWAPEPVWMRWRRYKFPARAGIQIPVVEPVA